MTQIYRGWFDGRRLPISDRVRDALEHHTKKYGKCPNIVELPLNEERAEEMDISVKYYRHILPNCMLIGIESAEATEDEQRTPEN